MFSNRAPYIKSKGYCPNPIVVHGIPKEADGRNYPNVIGTSAWEQFWSEQIYYIINGYQTGGLWVPGRYYYYMNFNTMNTIERGAINPDNTDLHLELAYYIDYCKKNGKHLMIPKGRRRGISEASHSMIIDYGYRFSPSKWQGGVAAGHSKPIEDFITKWKFAESQLPPELFIGKLKMNDSEIIQGWVEKNELNTWTEKGIPSSIYTRTMFSDPNLFKGLFLNDVVVEEVGEFENFLEFFDATKDCFMSGQKQVGSCFIYGTGGRVDKGSKDFKEAWESSDSRDWCRSNNVERWVVDARRFYYYGNASLEQQRLPAHSELFKKYKPYQLIGVEDLKAAEEDIMKRREEYLKIGDLVAYNRFVQNNPLTEQEIFRKTAVNNFDTALLNIQRDSIMNGSALPYSLYRPEFVKDDKTGMIKQPLEVKMIPLQKGQDESEAVYILDDGHPFGNFINRYCAGIDSYNTDQSKSSKSLGAMCVIDRETLTPVAIIRCRPKRKEIFFDLCLKLSIYYKMHAQVLGDVASDTILEYFANVGCYGYLADRPKKFESLASEQMHTKWVRLTSYSKPAMIGLMQFHVNNHIAKIKFPQLIDEILSYDEGARLSDNDLADAYGIALMQNVSSESVIKDLSKEEILDRYSLPQFVPDGNGGMRIKGDSGDAIKNIQQDENLFRNMFGL